MSVRYGWTNLSQGSLFGITRQSTGGQICPKGHCFGIDFIYVSTPIGMQEKESIMGVRY